MNGTRSSSSEAWRMIRSYAGGGAHDTSLINRIMLRFRPIAPKPAACPDRASGGVPSSDDNRKSSAIRRKRKYVRVPSSSTGCSRRKKNKSSQDVVTKTKPRNDDALEGERAAATTLQLLPDRSTDLSRATESDDYHVVKDSTIAQNPGLHTCSIWEKPGGTFLHHQMKRERSSASLWVVQAWATVECVTGTCTATEDHDQRDHGEHITDAERMMNLERDTCPGFVSDGSNGVTWVNAAFKKMVTKHQNERELEVEVVVWLVIKGRIPAFYSAFTGHVKLQYYAGGPQRHRYSRVLPCDLWRMGGGGFAWRLDVEAALTLGRT